MRARLKPKVLLFTHSSTRRTHRPPLATSDLADNIVDFTDKEINLSFKNLFLENPILKVGLALGSK